MGEITEGHGAQEVVTIVIPNDVCCGAGGGGQSHERNDADASSPMSSASSSTSTTWGYDGESFESHEKILTGCLPFMLRRRRRSSTRRKGSIFSGQSIGSSSTSITSSLSSLDSSSSSYWSKILNGSSRIRRRRTRGGEDDEEQQQQQQRSSSSFFYRHFRLSDEHVQLYISKYGNTSMSYVHLHKNYYHYEVPGIGLVSYCWVRSLVGRTAFVLVDPLASPGENMLTLLSNFHADVPGIKNYAAISGHVAEALVALGFDKTRFGLDYYADLKEWKPPKSRRRYLSDGKNRGLVVKEMQWHEVNQQRVREISKAWLSTKKQGTELQMMTWPFKEGDEWKCRKFYCLDKTGKIIAYIFYTPCFRNDKVIGYQANVLRRDIEHSPPFVLDYILLKSYLQFKEEKGLEFLSLSTASLHGIEGMEMEAIESTRLRRVFKRWYNMKWSLYNFRSMGAHKDHYKVNRVEPIYACTNGRRSEYSLRQLLMTVTNVLPVAKFLHGID